MTREKWVDVIAPTLIVAIIALAAAGLFRLIVELVT